MNPLDLEEFKRQGYMMIDFLTDYYKNIERCATTYNPWYHTLDESKFFVPNQM
jgi:hypothetical protein